MVVLPNALTILLLTSESKSKLRPIKQFMPESGPPSSWATFFVVFGLMKACNQTGISIWDSCGCISRRTLRGNGITADGKLSKVDKARDTPLVRVCDTDSNLCMVDGLHWLSVGWDHP